MNLYEEVYRLVKQIPRGKISTYKEIAIALGDPIAARAVGLILNRNEDLEKIPCYRIIESNGSLGGYALGINEKIRRLMNDGIKISVDGSIDIEKYLFRNFKTDKPLEKLRKEQEELRKRIITEDRLDKIEIVAGMDMSYFNRKAKIACVVFKNHEVIEEKIFVDVENFPYVPTYLSYRELHFVMKIFNMLKNKPDLIFIDGSGILHPRSLGLATHAGILLNTPTIGITKKLLCGEIRENKIFLGDRLSGFVLKNIFISPGYKISPKSALKIVEKYTKNKLPEPLRLAHRLSKF